MCYDSVKEKLGKECEKEWKEDGEPGFNRSVEVNKLSS